MKTSEALTERSRQGVHGRLTIRNRETGEVLLTAENAIHPENMVTALATSLADRPNGDPGFIYQMAFGSGAAATDVTGTIRYSEPNTAGINATLYNQTYAKVVDANSGSDTNTAANFMVVNHTANTFYADIVVTCTLDYNEPAGQAAFDNATDPTGNFIFNEIGLKSYDATAADGGGRLLTHAIFRPVQKALNVALVIEYTIRLVME